MRKQTCARKVPELSNLFAVLFSAIKSVYISVIVHILAIFITVKCELKEIKRTNKLIYGAATSACSRPLN
jgi:hypothetical protein